MNAIFKAINKWGWLIITLITSCSSFNNKVLDDPRFASGKEYETHKKIAPKVFRFDNYTFATGYPNDSGVSSLGMFLGSKEILYNTAPDGVYDSVFTANLNNDGIPDFLIIFCYEDGCDLSALISKSKMSFYGKELGYIGEVYCPEIGDTMQYLHPQLVIKDINNDGKEEIIVNLAKYNNQLIANSCTDTIYADK